VCHQSVCHQSVCHQSVCHQSVCHQSVCHQVVCHQGEFRILPVPVLEASQRRVNLASRSRFRSWPSWPAEQSRSSWFNGQVGASRAGQVWGSPRALQVGLVGRVAVRCHRRVGLSFGGSSKLWRRQQALEAAASCGDGSALESVR